MPIAAECGSCRKRFKANDKLAGKKVKCPQCGGTIQIPVPTPPKQDDGDLYGLAQEPSAPAKPKAEPAGDCPSCGAALMENAVLCVVCGYDLRSGQKLQTGHVADADAGPQVTLKRKDWKKEEQEQEKKAKKKKRKRERGEIPQAIALLRGCAVAFGTAMIGVGIWCALSWFTWGGWGIMAIVVGGLAGTGMMIGYGHEDALPGIISAVIAFISIIIGKVVVFAVVVMSVFGGAVDELAAELPEDEFAMEEMVDEESPDDEMMDEEYAEEGDEVEAPAGDQVTPDGGAGQVTLEDGSFDAGTPADVYPDVPYNDTEAEEPIGGWFAEFFAYLFMSGLLWDILWIAIGCAMAYKVGSGGQWWED